MKEIIFIGWKKFVFLSFSLLAAYLVALAIIIFMLQRWNAVHCVEILFLIKVFLGLKVSKSGYKEKFNFYSNSVILRTLGAKKKMNLALNRAENSRDAKICLKKRWEDRKKDKVCLRIRCEQWER